jgi:hypothetical protein
VSRRLEGIELKACDAETSPLIYARVAGFLYLIIIVFGCGSFAALYETV